MLEFFSIFYQFVLTTMNAIIYKTSRVGQTYTITDLFELIQQRQFEKVEASLISLVEDVVSKEYDTSADRQAAVDTLQSLYNNFNDMYFQWFSQMNPNIDDEFYSLVSRNHDNILIAHCTDAESMDDLLYETIEFLMDETNNEAHYHLACYKRMLL